MNLRWQKLVGCRASAEKIGTRVEKRHLTCIREKIRVAGNITLNSLDTR